MFVDVFEGHSTEVITILEAPSLGLGGVTKTNCVELTVLNSVIVYPPKVIVNLFNLDISVGNPVPTTVKTVPPA